MSRGAAALTGLLVGLVALIAVLGIALYVQLAPDSAPGAELGERAATAVLEVGRRL